MSVEPDIKASRIVGCTLLHQVLVSAIAAAVPVAMPELVREAGLFEGLAGLYALSMYAGAVAATLPKSNISLRLQCGFHFSTSALWRGCSRYAL